MGNKLECSCGSVSRKGYRCEDALFTKQQQQLALQQQSKQPKNQQYQIQPLQPIMQQGHLRLWAEVFHVSNSPNGGICWKRLSDDLVPVNINCIKETPNSCQFQITAYNTMVDKVLDVRLNQPGTKLGQASECFVYWKDTHTSDTWGLNFMSSLDAHNFRQLCTPAFKIARKASSSYSLRLSEQQAKKQSQFAQQIQQQQSLLKRKPQSTPSSPSARRTQLVPLYQMDSTNSYPAEFLNQKCTCMLDNFSKQRNGRVRYAASSTLPKSMFRQDGRLIAYPSSNNLITASSNKVQQQQAALIKKHQLQQQQQQQQQVPNKTGPIRSRPSAPMLNKAQLQQQKQLAYQQQLCRSAACTPGKYNQNTNICDARCKSKSSDDIRKSVSTETDDLVNSRSQITAQNTSLNAKRLHQLPSVSNVASSSVAIKRSVPNYSRPTSVPNWNFNSEESTDVDLRSRNYRSETGRRRSLERTACIDYTDQSPTSDTYMIESLRKMLTQKNQTKQQPNETIATPTPSTSGDETGASAAIAAALATAASNAAKKPLSSASKKTLQKNISTLLNNKLASKFLNNTQQNKPNDQQSLPLIQNQLQQPQSTQNQLQSNQQLIPTQARSTSPTVKLLQEYESHLRNLLARGTSTELENFSLNTFENILSQSIENVVTLMGEVQSELDAIRREEQQYRNEDTLDKNQQLQPQSQQLPQQKQQQTHQQTQIHQQQQTHPKSHQQQIKQEFQQRLKNHSWSRSYTLPSRHSLSVPLTSKHNSNVAGISPNISLGYGLNMTGLTVGSNDLYREMKKRTSTPFLDAISMENLAYLTGCSYNTQASFESTDSRANLTWSEVSDDDELAISDDEDDLLATGRNFTESPFRQNRLNSTLQCIGAVRKTGFLSVKKWLLRKPAGNTSANVELARKRGWKSYWVCLKGTTLLFYICDQNNSLPNGYNMESKPKHLIILDECLIVPIPEHPKRDFVFCLSTVFGDAYLFQCPCQLELDNWTTQIHCACGAAFSRHRGKSGTINLLQDEFGKLQVKLEQEAKMKHMNELQLNVIADLDTKRSIQNQIRIYETQLEKYFVEQFRLRSYIASILEHEQPNPKTLLTRASKYTKGLLNKLGVFNVSSLHAHICASNLSTLNSVLSNNRGISSRRRGQLTRNSSAGSRPSSTGGGSVYNITQSTNNLNLNDNLGEFTLIVQVLYPNEDQAVEFKMNTLDSIEDLLWQCCTERSMQAADYYLQCKTLDGNSFVPCRTDLIKHHHNDTSLWKISQKTLYQVELCRNSLDQLFGFSVEAELVETNSTKLRHTSSTNILNSTIDPISTQPSNQSLCQTSNFSSSNAASYDELCIYVSRVEENSLAAHQQLCKGDEIMVINGSIVSELDMMYIESVLQEELSLCMMLRSCRDLSESIQFNLNNLMNNNGLDLVNQTSDQYIESLVCPPPPSDVHISDEMIGKLIAPPPIQNYFTVNSTSPNLVTTEKLSNFIDVNLFEDINNKTHIKQDLLNKLDKEENFLINQPSDQASDYANNWLDSSNQYTATRDCNSPIKLNINQNDLINRNLNNVTKNALLLDTGSLDQVEPLPAEDEEDHHEQEQNAQNFITISDNERLKKVVKELVDTEKSYVKNLNNLLQLYLEPMQQLNLLSNIEVRTLLHNIQDMITFQRELLNSILQALNKISNYEEFTCQSQFSNFLCELSSIFIENADKFKVYCEFCANHSKAMKTLYTDANSNHKLIEFITQICRGEHACTLESYLIKPIQRILKYPLLLQQLKCSTPPDSIEHKQLTCALQTMENVAEYINEMQRIHEEYGAIFEHLQRQYFKFTKQHVQLSTGELNYYGEVKWQNIHEFLGKMKKNLDLYAICFVFKSAVVFLCKERIRQKKKFVANSNKLNEIEIIRYQVLMPVNEVQVRVSTIKLSSQVNEDLDKLKGSTACVTQYNWELIHLKCNQPNLNTQRRTEKVYQLSNASNNERNTFLRHIRQIIRESVRKMSLPSTKINSNNAFRKFYAKQKLASNVIVANNDLDSNLSSKMKDIDTQNQLNKQQTSSIITPPTTTITTNSTSATTCGGVGNGVACVTSTNTICAATSKTTRTTTATISKVKHSSLNNEDKEVDSTSQIKIPAKSSQRNLPLEDNLINAKKVNSFKNKLSKISSTRTFEKQQTIDEKSSPPL